MKSNSISKRIKAKRLIIELALRFQGNLLQNRTSSTQKNIPLVIKSTTTVTTPRQDLPAQYNKTFQAEPQHTFMPRSEKLPDGGSGSGGGGGGYLTHTTGLLLRPSPEPGAPR